MRRVIQTVGPCTLKLRRDRFGTLARSILSQQISGHAARAIQRKLEGKLPEGRITAAGLARLSDQDYRAAGVSAPKAKYLQSLGSLTLDGTVRLTRLAGRSDEDIIEDLTRIKGIGVWTVQMFLMFSLGRPDVLPYDDLGVKQAIRNLHGLEQLPGKRECLELAKPWRPYATIASWYCWRSLEFPELRGR